ncbi:MAG: hypothetical protein V3V18_13930 [Methylococcales bacterium]
MAKKIVEHQKSISIGFLIKNGLLYAGSTGILQLSINGKTAGSVKFEIFDNGIALDDEFLKFGYTPTKYSRGLQTWFICPDCKKRIFTAYLLDYWACKQCHHLNYASQHRWTPYRLLGNAQMLRVRLGGSPDITQPFPEKPEGIQQKKYNTMYKRAMDAEQEFYRLTTATHKLF